MRRTYELALVLAPTLSDEEQAKLVDEYKKMITDSESEIVKEESWGKKKLAFPIDKQNEGRYVFLYVVADGVVPPVREIETRLNQNEQVLRYLWVRTDEDLQRAVRKGKVPVPAAEIVGIGPQPAAQPAKGA